jgi:probable phosphoglycerate mutase
MTTIAFVRHGQTDWNKEGRLQGGLDVPLNEEGKRQAHLLALRLAEERWDHLFSSDLRRAAVTADVIGKTIGLKVAFDARLRERRYGRLEGLTAQERIDRWGPDWSSLDHGIESDESIRQRGLDFIADVCSRHPDQRLLVVSHGSLIRHTLKALIAEGDDGDPLENTSVTIIRNEGGRWQLLLRNCTRHLHHPE